MYVRMYYKRCYKHFLYHLKVFLWSHRLYNIYQMYGRSLQIRLSCSQMEGWPEYFGSRLSEITDSTNLFTYDDILHAIVGAI